MENPIAKVTVSAGGVVLNGQGEILLVHQDKKTWSFPKGHVEASEEPLDAAYREILEETGLSHLDYIKILGSYGRYKIGLNHGENKEEWKVLIFFLFKVKTKSSLNPKILHPLAQWIRPERVEALLTSPQDKAFYKSIKSML